MNNAIRGAEEGRGAKGGESQEFSAQLARPKGRRCASDDDGAGGKDLNTMGCDENGDARLAWRGRTPGP